MTLRPWDAVAGLAFVVGVGLGWVLHGSPSPVPSVRAAQHATRAAVITQQRAETVYVRTRDTLTRVLTRYDSVRVRDTVVRDSVVYMRADVADQSVRACRATVTACDARHAADSAVLVSLRDEIAARDAARPSRLHTVLSRAAWLGVGYVAGRAGVGAGVSLRVPF